MYILLYDSKDNTDMRNTYYHSAAATHCKISLHGLRTGHTRHIQIYIYVYRILNSKSARPLNQGIVRPHYGPLVPGSSAFGRR